MVVTLASGESEFSLTRGVGTELAIRIEGPDIETQTETLVFDESTTREINLTAKEVEPETVTLSVTVEDSDGNRLDDADIAVDGEVLSQGTLETELAATGGTRTVSAELDGFISEEREIPADEDQEVTFALEAEEVKPACSDGIDNDGDGVADENDPGCVKGFASRDPSSPDFEYEPEDDSEVLRVQTETSTSGNADERISGKEGEMFQPLFSRSYPKTIQYAVGEIGLAFENRIEKSQTGEAFAIWVICGETNEDPRNNPNTKTTDIVPDDQSVDGFRDSPIHGMTRDWVSEGRTCGFYAIHAKKALGEKPTNGEDGIFFGTEEKSTSRTIQWLYEPEEVQ